MTAEIVQVIYQEKYLQIDHQTNLQISNSDSEYVDSLTSSDENQRYAMPYIATKRFGIAVALGLEVKPMMSRCRTGTSMQVYHTELPFVS